MADTVTEDPEPPAADKPEPAKSFWGSFNQADMRMLVVTVAGTVVGGTLLVMVLALAVIIAKSWSGRSGGIAEGSKLFGTGAAGAAVLGFLFGRALRFYKKRRHDDQTLRVLRAVVILLYWVAAIEGLILVLALLGAAAGVK
jgi:hypothetical protein